LKKRRPSYPKRIENEAILPPTKNFPNFLYLFCFFYASKVLESAVVAILKDPRSLISTARKEKRASKTMKKSQPEKFETTLGELIAAASEVAFEYSNNDAEAYQLARLALVEILRHNSYPLDLNKQFENTGSFSELVH
jgi:hypothetical protein